MFLDFIFVKIITENGLARNRIGESEANKLFG
jgi:hypothetical protein